MLRYVVAAAALALVLPVGLAISGLPAQDASARDEIVVVEHATSDATIDLGAAGDSVGDTLVFANDLYDAADANKVGTDQGSCVRTVPGKAWECTWTAFLPDGQVVVQGPFYDDGSESTLAIIGGTGKFGDASGEMVLSTGPNASEYTFTYKIDD